MIIIFLFPYDILNKQILSTYAFAIHPGQPLHVSVAYSGRIACAYQTPGQQATVSTDADGSITFSCSLAIYECESTGGKE